LFEDTTKRLPATVKNTVRDLHGAFSSFALPLDARRKSRYDSSNQSCYWIDQRMV